MTPSSLVLDPVCGMMIEPAQAAGSRQHREATYHLCSVGCLAKFDADADAYIAATRADVYRVWTTDQLRSPDAFPEP